MMYLLDAGVLITANNTYYPVEQFPEYWAWLQHVADAGHVKIPLEIYEEIKGGPQDADRDQLFAWIQEESVRKVLVLHEDAQVELVQRAVREGYAHDLVDDEVEQIGRDPFLLAYALADPGNRCVVTTEVLKPSRKRQNRHLPDVCGSLGLLWCDTFQLNRQLGFRTNWRVG
jgi:hypothetical protein